MLKRFLDFLAPGGSTSRAESPGDRPDGTPLAVCALLMEIAAVDGEFSEAERDHIAGLMRAEFGVADADLRRIMDEADRERRASNDYWTMTRMIADTATAEEKIEILEMLWRVVYTDGAIHAHEDYLVKKLARLLGVPHDQLIGAKLRVKP